MINKIFILTFFILSSTTIVIAKNESKNIDLSKIKIEGSKKKSKEDYEKKENLIKKPIDKEDILNPNEKDLNMDGTVNFNKDTKTIDNVKINLGKNF